jgi:hypothetical protein
VTLYFAYSWAKLAILRGNDNQMHVFRHDHITEKAESAVFADTQDRFDDGGPERGVSQDGNILVCAEGHESGATVVVVMSQLHVKPIKAPSGADAITIPTRWVGYKFPAGGILCPACLHHQHNFRGWRGCGGGGFKGFEEIAKGEAMRDHR